MKLFKTSDRNIVESCQEKFGFVLPSIQLDKRRKKFEKNYMSTCDMYIIVPGDIYTQSSLRLLRVLVCFFSRIFVCGNLYNSYLMTAVYS